MASTYHHILLATDLASDAAPVAERALDLAQRYSARLSLVHVVEYMPLDLPTDLVVPDQVELSDAIIAHARQRLLELATQLGVPSTQAFLEFGSPKIEITRIAQEHSVDLIVIGSHGRRGLQLLLGSTANGVLHGTLCDALAVRIAK